LDELVISLSAKGLTSQHHLLCARAKSLDSPTPDGAKRPKERDIA